MKIALEFDDVYKSFNINYSSLWEHGAKVDLDPLKCINLAISMSNFPVFDLLMAAGANIHETHHDFGSYPTTIASSLSDYRFISRLLQLGIGLGLQW